MPIEHYDHLQDLSGLICPLPILRIKAAVARMAVGERLLVIVTNRDSVNEVHLFSRQSGHQLLAEEQDAGRYRFLIEKRPAKG